MKKVTLFPNLEAEQTRFSLTDEDVANELGITRTSYNQKKKKGHFKLNEIIKLCSLFDTNFGYLFKLDNSTEV